MKFRKLPFFPAIVLALVGSQYATADYVAYSVGENEKSPLPERVDKVDTRYLLNIEWGEYAGRKARLGVLEVDNNSSANSYTVTTMMGDINYSDSTTGVPVNGIEAIVIDSLSQTGRFRLVERTELGSVLDEQDLAASGRIAQPSGAKTGNVLGAEYLVQLVVTDYETNTSGTDKGIGGLLTSKVPLLGGVKAGSTTSIGEIEVSQVQEKFSIARPVSLNGTPDRGDKVMGAKAAAPLEFADKWKKPK
jgi:hypothetical protein